MAKGKVYLVGAGPGDPKLITVKGLEAVRKSDAIVYDRLASPRLLKYAKRDAELIYVGKLPDRHTMKQDEINRLLVELALQGKVVTRLKGGDPSVFGRVGEEAWLLVDNGIEFEIVPGISSAIAVPIYAGIPVTHRDMTSSLSIVTGHENPDKLDSMIDWEKLSTAMGTIVFLMGVAKIEHICNQLVRYGKAPNTPVALIRWGTRAEQETLTGTLDTIAKLVKEADFQPPAVIVIGEVVKLRDKLRWVENKPLFGRRILVTRSREQASELVDLIEEMGGEPIEFPVIATKLPVDQETVRAAETALRPLARYDWIVFTSVNGVDYFMRRLRELGLDIRSMHAARIAAVGPKTAEALAERGLCVDVVPEAGFRGETLAQDLIERMEQGQSVLLPRGSLAADDLPAALAAHGLQVTEAVVYETVPSSEGVEDVIDLLTLKQIHSVTFTSSSTVTNLVNVLRKAGADPLALLSGVSIVCMGPVTSQTAAECGLKVTKVAQTATIASLVEALRE